ncbi:MAG: hypothetical protein JKY98_00220 [Gammaproteobacteria bacterium]|nr:hypothetical protein [Gammaproteobacteria bacterium]
MTTEPTQTSSPKTVFTASLIALGVALVILFVVILPAELDYDPFGIGQLLGISGLSSGEAPPLEGQEAVHSTDYVEFYLEPFQSVEYKYSMDIDAPMIFSWVAEAELYYDMHAEPAGLGEEYAESFEQGTGAQKMGSYHAPFTGIHGWFWENRGNTDVTVKLYSSGFYHSSKVFSANDQYDRDISPVTQ